MNVTNFKYSLLKYVHSDVLGEEITLGVLFVFPERGKVHFSYPRSLERIRHLYRNFSEWQLNSFLSAFTYRANELSIQLNPYVISGDIEGLITSEFLISDSSSLRFSPSFTVIDNRDCPASKQIEDFEAIYLSDYGISDNIRNKHDEPYISKRIKSLLIDQKPDISKHLNPGYQVVRPDKKASLKIDFWWQNGVSHLVKPISFDLEEPVGINNKAILAHGQLNYLKEYAKSQGYCFDLLIAKPQSDDHAIKEAYSNALDILKDTDAPVKVYEESELDKYSLFTIAEIESHLSEN